MSSDHTLEGSGIRNFTSGAGKGDPLLQGLAKELYQIDHPPYEGYDPEDPFREDYVPVLNLGHVKLVDMMGSDMSVVRAARVSYGLGSKGEKADRGVLRYMLSHEHGTPFEHTCMTFRVKLPIFIARQWIRHRIGVSFNEISGRYSIMKDEFFTLNVAGLRKQSKKNKQGSSEEVVSLEEAEALLAEIEETYKHEYDTYKKQIAAGVSNELARAVLPLAMYTEWYFTVNLRSLFAFCKLRSDSHAQEEIRVYSDAMLDIAAKYFPWSVEAFKDYQLNAIKMSALDIKAFQELIRLQRASAAGEISEADVLSGCSIYAKGLGMSDREYQEFIAKSVLLQPPVV